METEYGELVTRGEYEDKIEDLEGELRNLQDRINHLLVRIEAMADDVHHFLGGKMCGHCDEDLYDAPEIDEDLDDEYDEPEVQLSSKARRFIRALVDLDVYAIAHAERFYAPVETLAPVAKPTYTIHTLWTCQEVGGFFYYSVKHELGSTILDVSLDTSDEFSYKVIDNESISIMAPEKLWGVDVTVKRVGL